MYIEFKILLDGFTDRIAFPLEYMPIHVGKYTEKLMTDKNFATVMNPIQEKILIRSTSWDKYKCTTIIHEGQNITMLDFSAPIDVNIGNHIKHTARLIEISEPKQIAGTKHSEINITYYDVNPTNYIGVPIVDHITSSELVSGDRLLIKSVSYKTIIKHKRVMPSLKQDVENVNGLDKVFKSNWQDAIAIRLYVNEREAETLAYNLPRAGTGITMFCRYITGAKTFVSLERIIPTVTELDYNLYQIDAQMKYDNHTLNHY